MAAPLIRNLDLERSDSTLLTRMCGIPPRPSMTGRNAAVQGHLRLLSPCGGTFLVGTYKPTPLWLPFEGNGGLDKLIQRFDATSTDSNPVRLFNP
jgi:hypothetical protein